MKKLKLDLDALKLDTFETTTGGYARNGTVLGQSGPQVPDTSETQACDSAACSPTVLGCDAPTNDNCMDPSITDAFFCPDNGDKSVVWCY